MYGSTAEEKDHEELPLVKTDNFVLDIGQSNDEFIRNPFGDKNNADFWEKVSKKFGDGEIYKWNEALNIVRGEEFIHKAHLGKCDPCIALLEEVHDKFIELVSDQNKQLAFLQQLTKLAEQILKADFANAKENKVPAKYSTVLEEHPEKKTILHLVADRNLVDLAEIVVELYPGSVYVQAKCDGIRRVALELALLNSRNETKSYDEMASFLVSKMQNGKVRELFISDDTFDARFRFADVIENPKMKETVVQILECCINPQWPFVPIRDGEDEEKAWSRIEDKPLQYHFHYRLLDGDQTSEPAKIDGTPNEEFDHLQPSCLQLLVESVHSDITIQHPVIRKLVDHKWESYGRKKILIHFGLYVLFIMIMGLAMFFDTTHKPPTEYSSTVDYVRVLCEILTIFFTLVYLFDEIDQMCKERSRYVKDKFNWFDLIGITLLLVLIPLRITQQEKAEYSVAAAAFLMNCLRVFKYFPAFKDLGVYSKTFAEIIRKDILIFSKLFFVVMVGFTGCVFLAMKAVANPDKKLKFWEIALKEARALTEGNPFDDNYDAYHVAVILLILCNMGAIIVILSNILIGQLSSRYEAATSAAEIRYSIDKAKFITRLEKSRFRRWNDRIAHYMDYAYISDESEILDLLSHWNDVKEKKAQSVKQAIRAMHSKMRK